MLLFGHRIDTTGVLGLTKGADGQPLDRAFPPWITVPRYYSLADGRQFLMGDQFTSADILLTTCLDWAIAYDVGICDDAHPYLERIQRREAYQRAQVANVPVAPITPVPATDRPSRERPSA